MKPMTLILGLIFGNSILFELEQSCLVTSTFLKQNNK
jgi:hypothetical protein